jgi:tetratricopeptide (TPR) repeat protein
MDPELSNIEPEDPRKPAGEESTPPRMDEFLRALDAYQQGMSDDNPEQVEAAAINALQLAMEEAEKNPTPALVLGMEAGECEARGDWAGAEACYRKVLALQDATGNFGLIFKAHYDLSRLFLLLGDLDRADLAAGAATSAARQANMFPVLMTALENQAYCALRRADYVRAIKAASEAVEIVEPGSTYTGLLAGALVIRARCRLASGDLKGASQDLATARPTLIDRDLSPILAGSYGRSAAWWEATAGIHAQQGDLVGACEAWAEAVKRRRHVASLAHVSGPYTLAALARSLQDLGGALEATAKSEESRAALSEAQNIWRELGLPVQAMR